MADSEPTHDNPRNTRNLPVVVQEGEVMRPAADSFRISFKKVVLVNNDQEVPSLQFLV